MNRLEVWSVELDLDGALLLRHAVGLESRAVAHRGQDAAGLREVAESLDGLITRLQERAALDRPEKVAGEFTKGTGV